MDNIIATISIIATIVGAVYSIFKKMDSEYKSYLERYYKEVLEPFYLRCILEKQEVYEFFDNNRLVDSCYQVMPTYIHMLLKDRGEGNNEKLKKILIVDFLDNRPTKVNSILKSTTILVDVGDYIAFLILLLIIPTTTILTLVAGVSWTIELLLYTDVSFYTLSTFIEKVYLIALIVLGMLLLLKLGTSSIKEHTYSLRKNEVVKVIESKLKKYSKMNIELFI